MVIEKHGRTWMIQNALNNDNNEIIEKSNEGVSILNCSSIWIIIWFIWHQKCYFEIFMEEISHSSYVTSFVCTS